MEVSKRLLPLREQSPKNIQSERGILPRMNRSMQMEGAFGAIKQDNGFRRFLAQGKLNVMTEMLLPSLADSMQRPRKTGRMKISTPN